MCTLRRMVPEKDHHHHINHFIHSVELHVVTDLTE